MIRIFGHFISLRAVLIATFELAAIIALYDISALVTSSVAFGNGSHQLYGRFAFHSLLYVTFWLTAAACGLYNAETIADTRNLISRLLAVSVLAYFVNGIVVSVLEAFAVNTVNLRLYYVINLGASAGYFLVALLFRLNVFSRTIPGTFLERRIIVLGIGELAGKTARLSTTAASPYSIAAFIPLFEEGPSPDVDRDGIFSQAVLGERNHFLSFIREHGVDEVVFASRERRGVPIDALMGCKLAGVIVSNFSDFWERQAGQVDLDSLNPGWMIFSDGFNVNWRGRALKRVFDIVVGTLLLIFTLPICVLTALAIKLDSPGPIFYRQERVGQNGRIFSIHKFRSMRQDAEKDGMAVWAQKQDARVTRVGSFIRRTRIDEIPQVFNVLAGDMSFVGPRPERPVFVNALTKNISFYDIRHQLKPGITGWAQIRYPYGASDEDAKAKLAFDLYYVKNWNLFLDLVILFQTVQVVLWRVGAR